MECSSVERLEFDHVIPEDMSFRIGSGAMEYGVETILSELQKCQLLCRRCHAVKTASDNGYNLHKHGTPATYTNHGCRCDKCRVSWAKYARKYSKAYYDKKRVK